MFDVLLNAGIKKQSQEDQKKTASVAPSVEIAKQRSFQNVFPKISTADPSISCSSEVLPSIHRPQPLYPSFLYESVDVGPQDSDSEFGVEIETEAATKDIPNKQVTIETLLANRDLPKFVEGPMKPPITPGTLEVYSDRLEMTSPKPGPPQVANDPRTGPPQVVNDILDMSPPKQGPPASVNVQSAFNPFRDLKSNDPVVPQSDTSDVLLMTPNDFLQVSETTGSEQRLRSEVMDTRQLLLKYQEQRQKLSSLKDYLNMLRSWEKKDPNLSSIDVELSQTEQEVAALKKSLQEQKNLLKIRVEKLTQNS